VFEICVKTSLEGKFLCSSSFLVCARLTVRVSAHAHNLEGTLSMSALNYV